MARRYKISKGKSKRMFSRGANRLHKKNVSTLTPYMSRGGVRL